MRTRYWKRWWEIDLIDPTLWNEIDNADGTTSYIANQAGATVTILRPDGVWQEHTGPAVPVGTKLIVNPATQVVRIQKP